MYAAGVCLVVAQVMGIYALVSRKADLVFALLMAALLVVGLVIGGVAVYDRIH